LGNSRNKKRAKYSSIIHSPNLKSVSRRKMYEILNVQDQGRSLHWTKQLTRPVK
jgi:hypothetical protein